MEFMIGQNVRSILEWTNQQARTTILPSLSEKVCHSQINALYFFLNPQTVTKFATLTSKVQNNTVGCFLGWKNINVLQYLVLKEGLFSVHNHIL